MATASSTTKPPVRGRRRRRSRDAQLLADIDFYRRGAGTEEIAEYSAALRDIARDLATEVDLTAAMLQKRLGAIGVGGLRDKWAAKRLARRTVRPLKQAADLLHGAGDLSLRFWKNYSENYAEFIRPEKGRDEWKFDERK